MNTSDATEQKRITREMQVQAFQDVPYIPTGFYFQPTAYRSTLTDIVEAMLVFWNVKKG